MRKLSLLFATIILTGCGGTTDDVASTDTGVEKESATSYDPCTLLTAEDVKTVFPDGQIENTKHDTEANVIGQKICYYSASATDMKFVQISLISNTDMSDAVKEGGQNVEKLFTDTKAMVEGAEEVAGLGDAAYFGGNGLKLGAGLNVLAKEKGVSFTIDIGLGTGSTDAAQHIALEKSVAEKVLSRL